MAILLCRLVATGDLAVLIKTKMDSVHIIHYKNDSNLEGNPVRLAYQELLE